MKRGLLSAMAGDPTDVGGEPSAAVEHPEPRQQPAPPRGAGVDRFFSSAQKSGTMVDPSDLEAIAPPDAPPEEPRGTKPLKQPRQEAPAFDADSYYQGLIAQADQGLFDMTAQRAKSIFEEMNRTKTTEDVPPDQLEQMSQLERDRLVANVAKKEQLQREFYGLKDSFWKQKLDAQTQINQSMGFLTQTMEEHPDIAWKLAEEAARVPNPALRLDPGFYSALADRIRGEQENAKRTKDRMRQANRQSGVAGRGGFAESAPVVEVSAEMRGQLARLLGKGGGKSFDATLRRVEGRER